LRLAETLGGKAASGVRNIHRIFRLHRDVILSRRKTKSTVRHELGNVRLKSRAMAAKGFSPIECANEKWTVRATHLQRDVVDL
jgi:hypothetical protein